MGSSVSSVMTAEARPAYMPLDFFLIRAPLLPIESYLALDNRTAPSNLPTIPQDPRICLALAIGSPHLLLALKQPSPSRAAAADLSAKLERYLIRMSTRPTPFGLFAGVGLGVWGETTYLRLGAGVRPTRTRPDMKWLYSVVSTLEARPEVRQYLSMVANPLALSHDDRLYLNEPTAGAP